MKPGEILPAKGELELNKGRNPIHVEVSNTGDRPIQVGSHYHFFETNDALKFDRKRAKGMRLDIAALQDRYSETFSPEETAALNMLTARAMDRVKITMADANTPRSERLNLTPFLEKI